MSSPDTRIEPAVVGVEIRASRLQRSSERRLFLTLPIAILAVQLVAGGVDLLLATALDTLGPGARVTTYGWITGIAALCALCAYPMTGAASDRISSRLGRRSGWVMVGAVGSSIGLLGLGQARAVPAMAISYTVAFGLLPVMLVPLFTSIPDRVQPSRRGAIGAAVGASTIVGGVAGNIAAARFAHSIELGVAVFAAVLVCGAVVFVLLGGEERGSTHPRARPAKPASSLRSVSAPPQTRGPSSDFAWFAVGRFALFIGYAAIASLAYYALRDRVGLRDPAGGVAGFALVTGVTTLVASLVTGPLSDRIGRRKPFVFTASVVLGVGLLVPALSPTYPAFLAAGAIVGIGFGAYLAVGTALASLVLPSAETSGRDIGLIGLANAAAQAVAPVAGAYVAAELGYPVMFVLAAMACFVAAATVVPIKSVR